jgi:hypothetical protein
MTDIFALSIRLPIDRTQRAPTAVTAIATARAIDGTIDGRNVARSGGTECLAEGNEGVSIT